MRVESRGPLTRLWMESRLAGREVYGVSAFLLGDTLVDSGFARWAAKLVPWARERGVRRVVHTHHHEDHVGGSAALRRELGVQVAAPPAAVALLADYYRLPFYRALVWGQPEEVEAKPLGAEVEVGGRRFQVIPTPGHAPDHVCLFQPEEGWLFTGDLYLSARSQYLRAVEDAGVILESLRRAAELEPRLVICSHAGFVERGAEALRSKIRYWEELGERAEALYRSGLGLRAISRRLLGAEGFMTWISGGAFAKYHLVASLLEMRGVYPEDDAEGRQATDEEIQSA